MSDQQQNDEDQLSYQSSDINSQKSHPRKDNQNTQLQEEYKKQQYDDMELGNNMEEKVNEPQQKINLQALPLRLYLDSTVTKTIVSALKALDKERPADPVEFFSYYLLASNTDQQ